MSNLHDDPAAVSPAGDGPPAGPLHLRSRVGIAALAAGVAAGLLGWLLGEPIHARFAPPKFVNTASSTGGFLDPAEVYKLDMAKQRAQIRDACLVFGAFGAALGMAMGLAGGWARGTGRASAWKGPVLGLALGGIAAAAATAIALPIYYRVHNPDTNDLAVGLMLQVAISAAVGAAGGTAFGVGHGRRDVVARAAMGGLLGACAGAMAYELLGAIAFPLDETSNPISLTSRTRLLGRLAVATLASAGLAWGVLDRRAESDPIPGALAHSS
ncbi:hypothetical protein OJF2_74490 [Aquisphaera giovannonii]|uniref:Uncharacterized protein n=1 Tax=Aquisphaera giovannonii TaxID=406548 RepID=A0A5B9WF06_9BACT|nr:hypothetical protein [Aquisphaera giovannonii]QEH38839.1 hypothetical protein OJF2_74490 [Aquisphaera giovannonii]